VLSRVGKGISGASWALRGDYLIEISGYYRLIRDNVSVGVCVGRVAVVEGELSGADHDCNKFLGYINSFLFSHKPEGLLCVCVCVCAGGGLTRLEAAGKEALNFASPKERHAGLSLSGCCSLVGSLASTQVTIACAGPPATVCREEGACKWCTAATTCALGIWKRNELSKWPTGCRCCCCCCCCFCFCFCFGCPFLFRTPHGS